MAEHPLPRNDEPVHLFKYQVPPDTPDGYWTFQTDYRGPGALFPEDSERPWVELTTDGVMWIRPGYSWDGATCFPDFWFIKIPSLPHDGGYQLIREGVVPKKHRRAFDRTIYKHCRQKGSGFFWASLVWLGVRLVGWMFARPKQ